MKEVRCAEIGYFTDCEGVIRGETEDEVLARVADHAKSVHSMSDDDLNEETMRQVRSHIRDV